jgi:hypothetical protein
MKRRATIRKTAGGFQAPKPPPSNSRRRLNPDGARPWATSAAFEFWLRAGEVYRNERGNRAYISDSGMPANVRWEASKAHLEKFGPKIYPGFKIGARRNPDAEPTAAELSEAFHGRPARKVTLVEEIEISHAQLADLGKLLDLHVLPFGERQIVIPFRGSGVHLGASPDGANLYFVGGKQALDLDSLGIDSDKDQLPIGECTWIYYHTSKAFHDFEPTDYKHNFGEENGILPILCYSQLNQQFYLEGGDYRVKPEGICN